MKHFPPKHYAEDIGVKVHAILGFIASGELRAVNVARNPRGQRPRWRIAESDWALFLAGRAADVPAVPARRRRKDRDLIEYF